MMILYRVDIFIRWGRIAEVQIPVGEVTGPG